VTAPSQRVEILRFAQDDSKWRHPEPRRSRGEGPRGAWSALAHRPQQRAEILRFAQDDIENGVILREPPR